MKSRRSRKRKMQSRRTRQTMTVVEKRRRKVAGRLEYYTSLSAHSHIQSWKKIYKNIVSEYSCFFNNKSTFDSRFHQSMENPR